MTARPEDPTGKQQGAKPGGISLREVIDLLVPVYGRPVPQVSHDPLAELVLTVLSQNTADTNSGRAFLQLMRRYPSWDAIAAAPVEEVVAAIQTGGLAQQKAPRIQAILRAVAQRAPVASTTMSAPYSRMSSADSSVPRIVSTFFSFCSWILR